MNPPQSPARHRQPALQHRPAAALLCGAAILLATLSGCLSSAPPAPPIRHFDPLPANPIAGLPPILRLTAAPHLGQEIAIRTAPRELQYDGQHHWLATPRDLLAAAIGPSPGSGSSEPASGRAGELHLANFELDLQHGVRARVVLHWSVPSMPSMPLRVIRAEVPADGRQPQQAAEAMAKALAQALEELSDKK